MWEENLVRLYLALGKCAPLTNNSTTLYIIHRYNTGCVTFGISDGRSGNGPGENKSPGRHAECLK